METGAAERPVDPHCGDGSAAGAFEMNREPPRPGAIARARRYGYARRWSWDGQGSNNERLPPAAKGYRFP
jgi:hypothetical protein